MPEVWPLHLRETSRKFDKSSNSGQSDYTRLFVRSREPPRSPARILIHSICPNSDATTLVKSSRCSVVLDAWKNSTNRDIQRLPELPERSIGWTATRRTCHTRLWRVRASIIFHERRGWMPWHFTPFFTWPVSSDSTSDGTYYIILTQRSVRNWNPIKISVHEKY